MVVKLSNFTDFKPDSDHNSGVFILVDHLYLSSGSMHTLEFNELADTMVMLLQDCQGTTVQMNCYGYKLQEYRNIPRETVVLVDNFQRRACATGENDFIVYAEASRDFYCVIGESGTIRKRAPDSGKIFSMNKVKTYLGRFTLDLITVDKTEESDDPESPGSYKSTHWLSRDGTEVLLTGNGEHIATLDHLHEGNVYSVENAIPTPPSKNTPNSFTVGTATKITKIDI